MSAKANVLDRKVLVEVCFRCDECDLCFHSEVIGMDSLNVDTASGSVTLNGRMEKTLRRCPECGRPCGHVVKDMEMAGGGDGDCPCACELDALMDRNFRWLNEKLDRILDEMRARLSGERVPVYQPIYHPSWIGDKFPPPYVGDGLPPGTVKCMSADEAGSR